MPTRQFEHEFEFDTGAHVPVHAAADAAVAAVPPPRFSTFLSLNVPTPQPTSSSTRPTLGPSLARTPVPTCGQRPRRNPRLRLCRCPRCDRLNRPRCCQRHCHRPSPRCISPPRLHRNRRPCRRPTELFSYTCSDPAAELRPRSKTHARSLAGAYFAATARSNRSSDASAVARADALPDARANGYTNARTDHRHLRQSLDRCRRQSLHRCRRPYHMLPPQHRLRPPPCRFPRRNRLLSPRPNQGHCLCRSRRLRQR